MKKLLSAKRAGYSLLVIFGIFLGIHILVLTHVVPYDIVWGSKIDNVQTMIAFEIFALVLTIIFMLIIAMKINLIKLVRFRLIVNIGVWIIMIYTLLNILGNLASGSTFEKWIFTPITVIMAIFTFRLIQER